MIVYIQWKSKRGLLTGYYEMDGWFLFGILPLYIRRIGMYL